MPAGPGRSPISRRISRDFGIELLHVLHPLQGIEHVAAPELGVVRTFEAAHLATHPWLA